MPLWPLEVTEYYARKYTGSVGCGWVLQGGYYPLGKGCSDLPWVVWDEADDDGT